MNESKELVDYSSIVHKNWPCSPNCTIPVLFTAAPWAGNAAPKVTKNKWQVSLSVVQPASYS